MQMLTDVHAASMQNNYILLPPFREHSISATTMAETTYGAMNEMMLCE